MDVHPTLYQTFTLNICKMFSLVLTSNPFMPLPRSFSVDYETPPLRERVGVIALVLALHLAVGVAWWMQPEPPAVVVSEMSVSIAMQQAPVVEPPPALPPEPPKPQPNGHGKVTTPDDETLHARSFTPVPPLPKGEGYSSSLREFHVRVERTVQPTPQPVVREVAETAPQVLPLAPPPVAAPAAASAPVVDTEPDYKASYLNNPRPPYPMVARRMSWEGKVILNVEVLAEGACGAVNVFRSSGHEVLDNAAMTTVKTWRFIPAKRAGRAFTQRFKVPINFSLEDEAA